MEGENYIQLFWPKAMDRQVSKGKFLFGFCPTPRSICISHIVDLKRGGKDEQEEERLLQCTQPKDAVEELAVSVFDEFCHCRPHILGVYGEKAVVEQEKIRRNQLWCTVVKGKSDLPLLWSVYWKGKRVENVEATIFFYDCLPNDAYFSLNAIDLSTNNSDGGQQQQLKQQHNIFSQIEVCIDQINVSSELREAIDNVLLKSGEGKENESLMREFGRGILNRTWLKSHKDVCKFGLHSSGVWKSLFVYIFLAFLLLWEGILKVLNWPISWTLFDTFSLTNVSFSARQLDYRLSHLCSWMYEYVQLGTKWSKTNDTRRRFVALRSLTFLVFFDVLCGVVLGLFVFQNNEVIARNFVWFLQKYFIDDLKVGILWISSNPAGLKLNAELSKYLCTSFFQFVLIWGAVFESLIGILPTVFAVCGIMGVFGATTLIALCGDVLSAFTCHTYLFFVISRMFYKSIIKLIYSLSKLFFGKKWNVLRKRVDSCEYDTDHFVLGTIVFVMVIFLLPTFAAVYMYFSVQRLFVLILELCVSVAIHVVNGFPAYPLYSLLYFGLLPGGIDLQVLSPKLEEQSSHTRSHLKRLSLQSSLAGSTVYFALVPRRIPLKHLFHQFYLSASVLVEHHDPFRVLKGFILGYPLREKFIPKMPFALKTAPSLTDYYKILVK
eukprot:Nk52_evm36s2612 gene=Nk52_evmTU36s2612